MGLHVNVYRRTSISVHVNHVSTSYHDLKVESSTRGCSSSSLPPFLPLSPKIIWLSYDLSRTLRHWHSFLSFARVKSLWLNSNKIIFRREYPAKAAPLRRTSSKQILSINFYHLWPAPVWGAYSVCSWSIPATELARRLLVTHLWKHINIQTHRERGRERERETDKKIIYIYVYT
jgi:hypothetical protein